MAKMASGCMFYADKLDADATARTAAAATTPAPATAPPVAASVHVINRRFKEAPEEVGAVDFDLCQFILRRIGNVTVRDSYAAKSQGSGRSLISLLSIKRDTCLSAKAASSLINALQSLLDVGLPTASVAHYNNLSGVALQINRALP